LKKARHYCPHASVSENWARVRVHQPAVASLISSYNSFLLSFYLSFFLSFFISFLLSFFTLFLIPTSFT